MGIQITSSQNISKEFIRHSSPNKQQMLIDLFYLSIKVNLINVMTLFFASFYTIMKFKGFLID